MSQKPLAGQRAIVTGASSGIGEAIARAYAEAGAAVLVNHHDDAKAAHAIADAIVEKGGRAVAVAGDVSRPKAVEHLFDVAHDHFGGVDILVANAGLQKDGAFTEMTLEDWRAVIDLDLTGSFLCAQEAARRFRRQGFDPKRSSALGKVLFVSSVHQAIPWAGHANYAAAKGGLILFMKSLAQEVAHLRIRVNGISPGAIRTPMNVEKLTSPEIFEQVLLKLIPCKRIGEPEDIAQLAVWLASDQSDYIHGTTIYIDGGMTLYPEFIGAG